MMTKLFICLCICLVVFIGSIAGFCKGLDFADSKKYNEVMIGTVTASASVIFLFASLIGTIVFVIKLFVFYLYGSV